MTTKFHLQLQMTLMTLTELQMHTDNPDKYETYERNIKLVKEQIMNEEEKQKCTGSQTSAWTQGIHPYPLRGPSGGASLRQPRPVSFRVG